MNYFDSQFWELQDWVYFTLGIIVIIFTALFVWDGLVHNNWEPLISELVAAFVVGAFTLFMFWVSKR